MKRFRVISLVSVVGLGLMLLHASNLIRARAAWDFGLRTSDFGLGRRFAIGQPPSASRRPWINLNNRLELPSAYAGAAGLQEILQQNLAQPRALASGDFDGDGVPDLVSGYVGPSGGILTLRRGNVGAIYPNSPEARKRMGEWANGRMGDETAGSPSPILPLSHSPFLPEARVFEVPEAPEFLGTGDFDADGHLDVVTAAVGSQMLYLISGDGQGGFGPASEITLPGAVTALVTGEVNRADGLADVVVGIIRPEGPAVLLFESPEGALRRGPEVLPLPAEAGALALGQLDEDSLLDLAVAAGHALLIVHGRDRRLSLDEIRQTEVSPATVEQLSFPFAITSIAVGDFTGNQRTGLALLSEDGTAYLLERGETASGRVGEWESGRVGEWERPLARCLVSARISSFPQDDLLVVDSTNHQLHLLMVDPATRRVAGTTIVSHSPLLPFSVSLDVQGEPVAVLPMRLNADALSDLVILTSDRSAPIVALTAPLASFTVNSTGDGGDSNTSDGVCNDGTGNCTLRAAIEQANASPGADTINFNIPGGGVPTITPTRALPRITDAVTIDGTTQPGSMVELNGAGAGVVVDGLTITGGNSVVRGLVINRFDKNGVRVETGGSNVIEGNYIGTDVRGTTSLGNTFDGVSITNAPGNTIGGTTTPARNLISGNNYHGIEIAGREATGNVVQGNYLGTNATGTVVLGNSFHGVFINDAPNTTVGGTAAPARNLISGNWDGVRIAGRGAVGNQVQGNYIGASATGTRTLGNSGAGVFINDAPTNTVGGTTTSARNVLAGNNAQGVLILGSRAAGNRVQGNHIGTNAAGTIALYNGIGVFITNAPGNTIGGAIAGARNVISGNGEGVRIAGSGAIGNQVQGNFIGTNAAGTIAVGNTQDGIVINGALENVVGGLMDEARNVISGNRARGVFIFGSGATGNVVQGNYIGTNAAGTAAVSNAFHGVFISDVSSNRIAQNVISGNNLVGVLILGSGATGNRVEGNLIGTDVTGTVALGNAVGVFVGDSASGNTVGGGNTIAFNRGDGVYVNSGTGNAIVSNSIFANADMGINLAPGGPTPNDDMPGDEDADTGANNLQNFPNLSEATMNGGTLAVRYAVSSITRHSSYPIRVEFFKADATGQGVTLLGSDTYTAADRTGTFAKAVTFTSLATMRNGDHIVATATDRDGNTSEFSSMVTITAREP